MTDFVIINGTDTRTLGVFCTSLPPVQTASERVNKIPVPGRSGYLHVKDDSFDPLPKRCGFFYQGSDPASIARFIMTAETIVFSNEPDKIYSCNYFGNDDLENTIFDWYEFNVNFECDPEKKLLSPINTVATVSPVALVNPGNRKTMPTFVIEGLGTIVLAVGTQEITLSGVADAITINGETMQCYDAGGNASDKMSGDFPVIEALQPVSVSWTGTVTKVTISPNWRWV